MRKVWIGRCLTCPFGGTTSVRIIPCLVSRRCNNTLFAQQLRFALGVVHNENALATGRGPLRNSRPHRLPSYSSTTHNRLEPDHGIVEAIVLRHDLYAIVLSAHSTIVPA